VAELFGYNNPQLDIEVDAALATRPDDLIQRAANKDALVVRNVTKVNGALIERLRESTSVRMIGRLGAGLDNIDVPAARKAGIAVVYAPDSNTESVAQFVLGQILEVTRHLSGAHLSTIAGQWNRLAFVGRELSELTLGIVGFGRIGARLAAILSPFGTRILVSTEFPASVPANCTTVPLSELFSGADIVSVHVPLTESTRGFIGLELLQSMRQHSVLINSSRGEVIQEPEMESFLRSRPDVTAVLDVRREEPPKDSLFRDLPNVRLSPHIAAFTSAAQKQVFFTVLNDVERVLSGGAPLWPAP
jgi:phosphoglycerate dehydrogenase-like enzyme